MPGKSPAARGNKMQNALLKRMQQGGLSKKNAIATAKKKGWIEQKGEHLALTEKGRDHAREAQRHLQAKDKTGGKYKYSKKKEKWTKKKKKF